MDWEADDHLWKPHQILGHKGGRKVKAKVLWSDLTTTWEDLNALFLHEPALVTKYAVKNRSLSKNGWYVVKKYLEIDSNHEFRCVHKLATRGAPVYKFGIQVPQSPVEGLDLDHKEGETHWTDTMNTEIGCLNQFETFRLLKPGQKIPEGFKKIPYLWVFDVKFDLR